MKETISRWSRFFVAFVAAACLLPTCSVAAPPSSDHATLPRVLLIGDSISIGYTKPVIEMLKGKAEVQRVKGNAGHTGMGIANLPKWLDAKHGKWDVIHFNWGLWDLCYRNPKSKTQGRRDKVGGTITHTPDQYRENLQKIVATLKKTNAKLIWASTTPVPEGEAGRKIGDDLIYNRVAAEVMKEHGIPVNDLHALMVPHMKSMTTAPGNVHFTAKGSELLAKQVAAEIEKAIRK
jgi:lysophospholipase L1-like esterase